LNQDQKNKLIRNQLEIAAAAIETAFAMLEEPAETKNDCVHPEEDRQDYSTMGVTRWQCKLCGFLFEGEEVKPDGDS
jgi:rubrerythrin